MTKDAASVAPHVYEVVFENDRVRLLEVRMEAGAESALHSHPDYLVYALSGGKVLLSGANGEGAEVEIAAGDVMWREGEEHAARNIGTDELHALFVELK